MARIERKLAQHYEWWLLGLVLGLVALGIGNLVSATHAGSDAWLSDNVRRQLVAVVLGGALGALALVIDYHRLERWAWLAYAGTLALLVATLVLAGATRAGSSSARCGCSPRSSPSSA